MDFLGDSDDGFEMGFSGGASAVDGGGFSIGDSTLVLGWRDVKMHSFDDANHSTYVDLKDKWKTLVHTVSIAPQQRRGKPVPQNLLDRVLAAHTLVAPM
ncbi:homeodomain-like, Ubiquitin-related domain protein [Artemisia annua]|uniref:Homeodomain-like, Ubiquitin-related domain protein n=1 Tax=Artemisia annua TaxID=35608 RepID=A0A2U1MM78_ARTAN|nr:homeodomain-like, Ubiquitin-related domain protein [Artemisia annua]